jgi:hypothetical protein
MEVTYLSWAEILLALVEFPIVVLGAFNESGREHIVASLEREDERSVTASFGACSRARGAIADKAASPGALGIFQLDDNASCAATKIWVDHFSGTSVFRDDGITRPKTYPNSRLRQRGDY